MKRRTEIILETEELILYKTSRTLKGFCPHCQTIVEIQPIDEENNLLDVAEIENLVLNENTENHSIET